MLAKSKLSQFRHTFYHSYYLLFIFWHCRNFSFFDTKIETLIHFPNHRSNSNKTNSLIGDDMYYIRNFFIFVFFLGVLVVKTIYIWLLKKLPNVFRLKYPLGVRVITTLEFWYFKFLQYQNLWLTRLVLLVYVMQLLVYKYLSYIKQIIMVIYYFLPAHIFGTYLLVRYFRKTRQNSHANVPLLKGLAKDLSFFLQALSGFLYSAGVMRFRDLQLPAYQEVGYPTTWTDVASLCDLMYNNNGFFYWTAAENLNSQLLSRIKDHFGLPLILDHAPKINETNIVIYAQRNFGSHFCSEAESSYLFVENLYTDLYSVFMDQYKLTLLTELKKDPFSVFHHNLATFADLHQATLYNAYLVDNGLLDKLFSHFELQFFNNLNYLRIEVPGQLNQTFYVPSETPDHILLQILQNHGYWRQDQYIHPEVSSYWYELFCEIYLNFSPYYFFWGKAVTGMGGSVYPTFAIFGSTFYTNPEPVLLAIYVLFYFWYVPRCLSPMTAYTDVITPEEVIPTAVYQQWWLDFRFDVCIPYFRFDPCGEDEENFMLFLVPWILIPIYIDHNRRYPWKTVFLKDYSRYVIAAAQYRYYGYEGHSIRPDPYIGTYYYELSPIMLLMDLWNTRATKNTPYLRNLTMPIWISYDMRVGPYFITMDDVFSLDYFEKFYMQTCLSNSEEDMSDDYTEAFMSLADNRSLYRPAIFKGYLSRDPETGLLINYSEMEDVENKQSNREHRLFYFDTTLKRVRPFGVDHPYILESDEVGSNEWRYIVENCRDLFYGFAGPRLKYLASEEISHEKLEEGVTEILKDEKQYFIDLQEKFSDPRYDKTREGREVNQKIDSRKTQLQKSLDHIPELMRKMPRVRQEQLRQKEPYQIFLSSLPLRYIHDSDELENETLVTESNDSEGVYNYEALSEGSVRNISTGIFRGWLGEEQKSVFTRENQARNNFFLAPNVSFGSVNIADEEWDTAMELISVYDDFYLDTDDDVDMFEDINTMNEELLETLDGVASLQQKDSLHYAKSNNLMTFRDIDHIAGNSLNDANILLDTLFDLMELSQETKRYEMLETIIPSDVFFDILSDRKLQVLEPMVNDIQKFVFKDDLAFNLAAAVSIMLLYPTTFEYWLPTSVAKIFGLPSVAEYNQMQLLAKYNLTSEQQAFSVSSYNFDVLETLPLDSSAADNVPKLDDTSLDGKEALKKDQRTKIEKQDEPLLETLITRIRLIYQKFSGGEIKKLPFESENKASVSVPLEIPSDGLDQISLRTVLLNPNRLTFMMYFITYGYGAGEKLMEAGDPVTEKDKFKSLEETWLKGAYLKLIFSPKKSLVDRSSILHSIPVIRSPVPAGKDNETNVYSDTSPPPLDAKLVAAIQRFTYCAIMHRNTAAAFQELKPSLFASAYDQQCGLTRISDWDSRGGIGLRPKLNKSEFLFLQNEELLKSYKTYITTKQVPTFLKSGSFDYNYFVLLAHDPAVTNPQKSDNVGPEDSETISDDENIMTFQLFGDLWNTRNDPFLKDSKFADVFKNLNVPKNMLIDSDSLLRVRLAGHLKDPTGIKKGMLEFQPDLLPDLNNLLANPVEVNPVEVVLSDDVLSDDVLSDDVLSDDLLEEKKNENARPLTKEEHRALLLEPFERFYAKVEPLEQMPLAGDTSFDASVYIRKWDQGSLETPIEDMDKFCAFWIEDTSPLRELISQIDTYHKDVVLLKEFFYLLFISPEEIGEMVKNIQEPFSSDEELPYGEDELTFHDIVAIVSENVIELVDGAILEEVSENEIDTIEAEIFSDLYGITDETSEEELTKIVKAQIATNEPFKVKRPAIALLADELFFRSPFGTRFPDDKQKNLWCGYDLLMQNYVISSLYHAFPQGSNEHVLELTDEMLNFYFATDPIYLPYKRVLKPEYLFTRFVYRILRYSTETFFDTSNFSSVSFPDPFFYQPRTYSSETLFDSFPGQVKSDLWEARNWSGFLLNNWYLYWSVERNDNIVVGTEPHVTSPTGEVPEEYLSSALDQLLWYNKLYYDFDLLTQKSTVPIYFGEIVGEERQQVLQDQLEFIPLLNTMFASSLEPKEYLRKRKRIAQWKKLDSFFEYYETSLADFVGITDLDPDGQDDYPLFEAEDDEEVYDDADDADSEFFITNYGLLRPWTQTRDSFTDLYDQNLLVGVYNVTQLSQNFLISATQGRSVYTPVDIFGLYCENSLGYTPYEWFDVYDLETETIYSNNPLLHFEFKNGLYLRRFKGFYRSEDLFKTINNEFSLIENIETVFTGFTEMESVLGMESAITTYWALYFGVVPSKLLDSLVYGFYWTQNWCQLIYQSSFIDTHLMHQPLSTDQDAVIDTNTLVTYLSDPGEKKSGQVSELANFPPTFQYEWQWNQYRLVMHNLQQLLVKFDQLPIFAIGITPPDDVAGIQLIHDTTKALRRAFTETYFVTNSLMSDENDLMSLTEATYLQEKLQQAMEVEARTADELAEYRNLYGNEPDSWILGLETKLKLATHLVTQLEEQEQICWFLRQENYAKKLIMDISVPNVYHFSDVRGLPMSSTSFLLDFVPNNEKCPIILRKIPANFPQTAPLVQYSKLLHAKMAQESTFAILKDDLFFEIASANHYYKFLQQHHSPKHYYLPFRFRSDLRRQVEINPYFPRHLIDETPAATWLYSNR